MGQTLSEQIFHMPRDDGKTGELVVVAPDVVMSHVILADPQHH